MKIIILNIILILCNVNSITAQKKSDTIPTDVIEILNSLNGSFRWKMIRPSDNKVLKTGTKYSSYHLDNLVLLNHETFDSSKIEQISLFGYRENDSTFISVGMYNVDIGPHIILGHLNKSEKRIEFSENDSSKLYLNILNSSKYYWTYQLLKNGIWIDRDLKIIFERK